MTGTGAELDVVDELMSDHREVASLLDRIGTTTDPAEKRDLADTAITELVRHAVAEEMYVYPAMRENLPDGEEVVEHDTEEHKELEQTMKELEGVDAEDPRFEQLVGELRSRLRHHVEDEETEQFPKLRVRLPLEKRVELREKVEKAKKAAPTRPHPGAPNTQLFHKLVGPGVGLVDRARDKLSGRS
ncbi:hemerythrin domain-containing protein [Pseudonocardia xinjiangensis]|uniref:Hemerythrin domain-containing protein n=1 Tax=Pseudonocardia xinjiangensis TaxID=75289 RepID=A0ABX1RLJ9_9PSEU|nr:hemerythrin domain-containing protein [Pseudonocardia xinjiangensis]NMH80359.1 hemerythrin domain-containing protein [Pseudonocardia xinjiangensis]